MGAMATAAENGRPSDGNAAQPTRRVQGSSADSDQLSLVSDGGSADWGPTLLIGQNILARRPFVLAACCHNDLKKNKHTVEDRQMIGSQSSI